MVDIYNYKDEIGFVMPEEGKGHIIKVIGVGGGGGNAVSHMYKEGIHNVSFVLCNTDAQALSASAVPVRLQLGKEGLGAGNKPEKAREAAEETIDSIKRMLDDGTKMVFITAGMGGGTGTGAAPIIAKISREMGILTVGIVTIPFKFEGKRKIDQALDGVEEMSKHVDALLVINNEKLREIYRDLKTEEAFAKADGILSVAAKSIAEIITIEGKVNVDFNDVKTVLENGGIAIMSMGEGEGEERVKVAINNALHSPLLSNSDKIYNSKKILLNIAYNPNGEDALDMEEMDEITEFMEKFDSDFEFKWGIVKDEELGKKVKVTILATGFGLKEVDGMSAHLKKYSIETAEKEAEEAEKEAERELKRKEFYGTTGQGGFTKRTPHIFVFKSEDLDNEDVILEVETVPTYQRSKANLDNIKKMSMGFDKNIKITTKENTQTEAVQSSISFES